MALHDPAEPGDRLVETSEPAAPTGRASRGRYRDALAARDFRLLAGSFLVDQVGGWAYSIVLAVYLFERTGSPTILALSAASRWVPTLIATGYAAVLADRYERTLLMRLSALVAAGTMVLLAVGVAVDAPIPVLLVLSALEAVALSPYRPAAGALTPEVVQEKDLAAANGLLAALENLVVVLGPALGGVLVLLFAPVVGIGLNAVTLLVAVGLLSRLRVRSTGSAAEEGGNALSQLASGVRALLSQRIATVLVLFAALDSAVYGASTAIYAPLSLELGTGAEGYSYLLAGAALGGVLGAGLANRLSTASRLAPVILLSLLVQSTPYLLTMLVDTPVAAFALQVVSGTGMIVVDVLAVTALQRDLPSAVLGRVMGVFDVIIILAITVASLAAAAVVQLLGLSAGLLSVGVVVPLLALLGVPALLRADRSAAATAERLRPRVELLSALDLFSGVDRNTLERLAAAAELRELPAREVVLREGDPADALWLLQHGSLTVRARGDRETARQLPPVLAPGYVGELGLLHSRPRTATVRTREPSTLLRLDGQVFLDALQATRASASLMSIAGVRLSRTPQSRVPRATDVPEVPA